MATISVPTDEEVLERYKSRVHGDMLGFEANEYIVALPFAMAKEFLKDDVTAESWGEPVSGREKLLARMKDYMEFAFGKAHNQRGISANRSVQHYVAWTWLAGDREFSEEIDREFERNYHSYGLPILRRICEFYGWNPAEHGD